MNAVATRFAPSPTGYLHMGGLRTALFNYLWAKKHSGLFRLRIEDTDQKRVVTGATQHLINLLHSFGLKPDGEIIVQSQNAKKGIYQKFAQQLVAKGNGYYCFCSEERLKELRAEQITLKQPPRYDGRCRELSTNEVQKNFQKKIPAVIRLKLPSKSRKLAINDGIHGTLHFDTETLTDAVLLKSDGFPTYHLASIVDDHLMGITHVIRGEEWIPSLPMHVLLYEFLSFKKPQFYHLPLILNSDRSKLSKRQGHVSVEWHVQHGYLKEALINYISFLGWNPGDEREIFSLQELVQEFDLAKINKTGAVFDRKKLDWYNAWYIKNVLAPKSSDELTVQLQPYLPNLQPEQRVAVFNLFYERVHSLAELEPLSRFLRELPRYPTKLLIFKKSTRAKTLKGLSIAHDYFSNFTGEWTHINLELGLKERTAEAQLSFGDTFWPVRVALSGLLASPSPTQLAAFLGKKETLDRITKAHHSLEGTP